MRVKGRPDINLAGRIETILPAGHEHLPTAALGYAGGGSTQIDLQDSSGQRAAEPFFEILVVPSHQGTMAMRPGMRAILRFETLPKPLIVQGWRALLQLFQSRFQI
jgi:putative peptide zinc metalloprotease protein